MNLSSTCERCVTCASSGRAWDRILHKVMTCVGAMADVYHSLERLSCYELSEPCIMLCVTLTLFQILKEETKAPGYY